jgi:hypothetical protein
MFGPQAERRIEVLDETGARARPSQWLAGNN